MISSNGRDELSTVPKSIVETRGDGPVLIARPRGESNDEDSRHQLQLILGAVRRHWQGALCIGSLLAILGGVAGWMLIVPQYVASAYLRIDSDKRPLIFQTADQASRGGSDFSLYKNTLQQLMKTPFVLTAALRDQEVADLPLLRSQPDPVIWLQENLDVSFPSNGEIMSVSLASHQPNTCVTVVNAVTDAFMNEVVVNERKERLARMDELERVYAEAESKVRNKRAELKTLATALGTGDSESLTVSQQAVLEQYGMLQQKLTELQFSRMQAQGELQVARTILEQNPQPLDETTDAEEPADEPSPSVKRLTADIESLEERLDAWVEDSPHPNVQRMKRQLLELEQLLEQEELQAAQREAERRAAANRVMGPDGKVYDLAALNSQIEVLSTQEEFLREKLDEVEAETRQLGSSSIDIELMRSEIDNLETVLRRVGEESERTTIELRTSSRIALLSPAERAAPPSIKKRVAASVALAFIGLMAPMGLLVAWDVSRKRVDNVELARDNLSLKALGILPLVSRDPIRRVHARSKRDVRERSELNEAVDAVASLVDYHAQHAAKQLFLITSAEPGEAKSTVASQLALSIALLGRKVAVVDFDLRRPKLHTLWGLERSPGVSEVLNDHLDLTEVVQHAPINPDDESSDTLQVITAGTGNSRLREKCANGQVQELFDSLRNQFDIVLVDSPPVLPVVDTRLMAEFADGVIMTLLRDQSRLPSAMRARELLDEHGAQVLGAIFVGGRSSSNPSYHYYTRTESPALAHRR